MSVLTKLGITEEIKAKGVVPPLGQRVGALVAKGEAEIGVQQITELLLIPGIDFVGPLPKELQANIVYATATPANREGTASRRGAGEVSLLRAGAARDQEDGAGAGGVGWVRAAVSLVPRPSERPSLAVRYQLSTRARAGAQGDTTRPRHRCCVIVSTSASRPFFTSASARRSAGRTSCGLSIGPSP